MFIAQHSGVRGQDRGGGGSCGAQVVGTRTCGGTFIRSRRGQHGGVLCVWLPALVLYSCAGDMVDNNGGVGIRGRKRTRDEKYAGRSTKGHSALLPYAVYLPRLLCSFSAVSYPSCANLLSASNSYWQLL